MIQLNEKYNREEYLDFLKNDFLTDFSKDVRPVNTNGLSSIKKAEYLGESKDLDLQVFEFLFEGSSNKRITLTKDAFSVMKSHATFRTLAIFHSADNKDWRFSLMTATPEPTEKGKVLLSYSNPKRLSFFLGPNAKINTPTKFLISKGKITDFEDLKNRFSIEVVNKEFYKEISQAFTKLVSGLLKLPSTQDHSQTNLEFAVRLIGRVIFCWFLREKKSQAGMALMPKELLSLEAVKENEDYYHKILEPIFFEVLNKLVKSRREDFAKEPFSSVPYLNGGLFSPQDDDYYKRTNGDLQSQYHNTLVVPDDWFKNFFAILETYNFTIDENTSYDEELSIDPEMLGRIFENLLAEINPETGESARKSTGSYYTPRIIVNYMIDESLLLYLKEQTEINEEKLRAIISYDLDDDLENPVTVAEKEKIIDALEKVKILDPACGSGAFPIGALQKIVFILQQIDHDGYIWKNKQLAKADLEFRRDIEMRFSTNEIDFFRKLSIIRKSIYGIDIQPIATEISRLRCFLTLIVDEEIRDSEDNRGIRPLPNLDFKFVTANSLIGLPVKKNTGQLEMYDDMSLINELKNVRDQYFNCDSIERESLKSDFYKLQNKLKDQLIEQYLYMGKTKAELTQLLSSWDPFGHNPSSWLDPEWMFGIKEGFDIVIGNPPYYSIRKLEEIQLKYLKKEYEEIHSGYNDIMYYFVFRGVQILKANGILGMITSNYYLGNSYSKLFRKFLAKSVVKIINFKEYQIFKEASIHTNIIFCSKNSDVPNVLFFEFNDANKELNGDIESRCSYFKILRSGLGFVWLIANNSSAELINKLYVNSTKLGDITNILKGATSGSRIIYTVTKEFAKHNNFETPLLKNSINSMDIQRYFLNDSGKVLIYIDDEIDIANYPNIKKYLLTFKDALSKRNEVKSGNYPWFRLERPREKYVFEAQNKLVVPYRSESNKFALDKQQGFNDGGGSYAIALKEGVNLDILYILGILNSTLMNWYYGFIGKPKGKIREYFNEPLSKIPIRIVDFSNPSSKETYDKLIGLVKQLLDLQLITHLSKPENYKILSKQKFVLIDQQINELVYKLYDLTPEEIEIVEKNTK